MGKKGRRGVNAVEKENLESTQFNRKQELYQKAVQSPRGDLSYCLKFHRTYIGSHEPQHLREDFCGTALLAATWCKGGIFRSAMGLDLDRPTLDWGARHNGDLLGGSAVHQLALLEGNVLDVADQAVLVPFPSEEGSGEPGFSSSASGSDSEDESQGHPRSKPCDIVCALNFGVCLLHTRSHLLRYFRHVVAALDAVRGGVFVADLLGGGAAERDLTLRRRNSTTGLEYTWGQAGFDPVTRRMAGTISLRDPQTRVVMRHAFRYDWRLWTVPDIRELLGQAGFSATHVWLRPIKDAEAGNNSSGEDDDSTEQGTGSGSGSGSEEEDSDGEQDFQAHAYLSPETRQKLQKGWSAYIVAVRAPQDSS